MQLDYCYYYCYTLDCKPQVGELDATTLKDPAGRSPVMKEKISYTKNTKRTTKTINSKTEFNRIKMISQQETKMLKS